MAQDPETQVVAATVRGELELPLEIAGEPAASRARAVEEASLALGIAHLLGRSTQTLSGGELQRVALAAALVGRPRVVLLDEPTSQLDPVAGDELIGLLRRLTRSGGRRSCWPSTAWSAASPRPTGSWRWPRAGSPSTGSLCIPRLGARLDAALATPLARLFDGAGMRPAPVSVKDARARLASHTQNVPRLPYGAVKRDVRRRGEALRVKRLWVELTMVRARTR